MRLFLPILALILLTIACGPSVEEINAMIEAEIQAIPAATPQPTPSPQPAPTPQPTATAIAIPTPLPTATPQPVPTPMPTATPRATPTPMPTATPQPVPTPIRLYGKQLETLIQRVVRIDRGNVHGSGFVFDFKTATQSAYILTNQHVVEDAARVTVAAFTQDGWAGKPNSLFTGEVLGTHEKLDLACIKITNSALAYHKFEYGPAADDGDDVMAIGYAIGPNVSTATVGVVSSLVVSDPQSDFPVSQYLIDAALNTGNSGGPLVNARGEVIGVNTWKYAWRENQGFALGLWKYEDNVKELCNNEASLN